MKSRRRLFAILAVLLLTIVGLWQCTAYRPSGDAVYDQIAQLVLRESSKSGKEPVFGRIASRFGVDRWDYGPYWMNFGEIESWPESSTDMRLLETRALLDPGSVPSLEVYKSATAEFAPEYFAMTMRVLYQEDEELALQAASAMIHREPDNAINYYLKAILLIHLGEIEEAHSIIRQGNAAPSCAFPLPYPARIAYQTQRSHWSAKNQRAAGVFWGYWCRYRPVSRWIMEGFKNLEVAAKLGYPPEIMDDYLIMLRRIGQSEQVPLTEQFHIAQIASWLIKMMGSEVIELDPQQQAEQAELMSCLDSIKVKMQENMNPRAVKIEIPMSDPPSTFDFTSPAMLTAILRMDFFEALPGSIFRQIGFDLEKEIRTTQKIAPLFDCLDPPPLAIWASGKTVAEYTAEQDGSR